MTWPSHSPTLYVWPRIVEVRCPRARAPGARPSSGRSRCASRCRGPPRAGRPRARRSRRRSRAERCCARAIRARSSARKLAFAPVVVHLHAADLRARLRGGVPLVVGGEVRGLEDEHAGIDAAQLARDGVEAIGGGHDGPAAGDPAPRSSVDGEHCARRQGTHGGHPPAGEPVEGLVPLRDREHGEDRDAHERGDRGRPPCPARRAADREGDPERHERRERVEVRAARGVQRPDERLREEDAEREQSPRPHVRARPVPAERDGQARQQEQQEREGEGDRVREERLPLRAQRVRPCGEVRLERRRRDAEEVLVAEEEGRPREEVRGIARRDLSQLPGGADGERHARTGEARARAQREEGEAEQRALRAGEIEEADGETRERAGRDVAERGAPVREEESGAEHGGRHEAVEAHPRRSERAAESGEGGGEHRLPVCRLQRTGRGIRDGRDRGRDGDGRELGRAERPDETADEPDARGLDERRERHPEPMARDGKLAEGRDLHEVPHEVRGEALAERDALGDECVVIRVGVTGLRDDEHRRGAHRKERRAQRDELRPFRPSQGCLPARARAYTMPPTTSTEKMLTIRSRAATATASCCGMPNPAVRTYTIAISTKPNSAGVSGTVVSSEEATATKTTPESGSSIPSAASTSARRAASASQMRSVSGPATGSARKLCSIPSRKRRPIRRGSRGKKRATRGASAYTARNPATIAIARPAPERYTRRRSGRTVRPNAMYPPTRSRPNTTRRSSSRSATTTPTVRESETPKRRFTRYER